MIVITLMWDKDPAIEADGYAKYANYIQNTKDLLEFVVASIAIPSIIKNFQVGGRPSWPALAETTLALKASRGHPSTPLVRTGEMQDQAASPSLWEVENNEARGYSAGTYDWYHHFGTRFMPRRPFYYLQEEDAVAIGEAFEDWLEEGVNVSFN